MADVALLAQQVQTAPNGYQVPGAQEIILKSVRAVIDGTHASGDFNVALQIISPSGAVMAEAVSGVKVAAGASAHATWFPNVNATNVGNGSGIQFDTDNEGGWLEVFTNDVGPSGFGMELEDNSGGGMFIESIGGIQLVDTSNNGLQISEVSGGGIIIEDEGDGGLSLTDSGTGGISLAAGSSGGITLTDSGTGGIRVESKANPGYPFNLGTNSVTVRAGNSNAAGAVEVGAFAGASANDLAELLIGDWQLGSPLTPFPGATILLSSLVSFWVANAAAQIMLEVDESGQVAMPMLPTVNPGGSGKLWNNAGVVNIT